MAREVPSDMDLERCLALASTWSATCAEQHIACVKETHLTPPSRLLDLGTTIRPRIVFLRSVRDIDCCSLNYMTLSHCWGNKTFLTTTKATLHERNAGILVSLLPKTFQDAIEITCGLHIRYLWIDSLCIIQDDISDWEFESANMASIYAGSQLNLAATQSANGNGGCFAERWTMDPCNQVPFFVEAWTEVVPEADYIGEPYFIRVRGALHIAHDQFTRAWNYESSIPDTSPLLSRAWVFQERLLSPRILHFHCEELVWECNTSISCECTRLTDYKLGSNGAVEESSSNQLKTMYSSITSGVFSEQQILDGWLDIVSQYSILKLTNERDRLPALAGLASRIASRLRVSTYIAGLWSQDLPRALCWKIKSSRQKSRPVSFSAPSWSWASVWIDQNAGLNTGHITYDVVSGDLGFEADTRFLVLNIEYPIKGLNPFVIPGKSTLKVRGLLIQVALQVEEQELNNIRFGDEVEGVVLDSKNADGTPASATDGDLLWCLLMGKSLREYEHLDNSPSAIILYALVLQKSKYQEGHYKRLGLLEYRKCRDWWAGALVVDIIIE